MCGATTYHPRNWFFISFVRPLSGKLEGTGEGQVLAGSRLTIVSSHSTQSRRSDLVKAVTQKQLSGRSDEQPRLSNDQAKGRRAFAASGD